MPECSKRGIKRIPSLPLPACESLVSAKGNLDIKKPTEIVDFVGNSNFIKESTKAGFPRVFHCKLTGKSS